MRPEKFKHRIKSCWVLDVCQSLRTLSFHWHFRWFQIGPTAARASSKRMWSPGVLISTSLKLQYLIHGFLARFYRSLPKMVFQRPLLWSFETKTETSAAGPWGKGNNGFIKSAELGTWQHQMKGKASLPSQFKLSTHSPHRQLLLEQPILLYLVKRKTTGQLWIHPSLVGCFIYRQFPGSAD